MPEETRKCRKNWDETKEK